jgi:hypothetical protein
MSRRLILHIGHHKTGSTTIQQSLYRHRTQLNDWGFDYFDIHPNHSESLRQIFEPDHYVRNRGITDAEALARGEETWSHLATQIKKNASDFILSGELLSTLHRPSIEDLHARMTPMFDEVLVVGYVRPPRSFVNSWAQQRLQRGISLPEMLLGAAPAPRYRAMFEKWIDLFGSDNVVLRLFHPSALHDANLLSDFARTIGLPGEFVQDAADLVTNTSIDMPTGNLLAALNGILYRIGKGRIRRERIMFKVLRHLKGVDDSRYRLPYAIEEQILQANADQIRWIEEVMNVTFDDLDDPVNPDQNPFDADAPSPEFELAARLVLQTVAPGSLVRVNEERRRSVDPDLQD